MGAGWAFVSYIQPSTQVLTITSDIRLISHWLFTHPTLKVFLESASSTPSYKHLPATNTS